MGLDAWIFIILYILASGIGAAIQKYGLMSLRQLQPADFIKNPAKTFRILFRSKYWVIGNILTFAGIGLLLEIYSLVELSLATPLLNLNIIIVILIGVIVFEENLGVKEGIGAALLLSGILPIAMAATEKSYSYNPVMFFVFLVALTVVGALLTFLPKIKTTLAVQKSTEIGYSLAAGTFFGLTAILINMTVISGLGGSFELTNISHWFKLINVYLFVFIVYNYLAYLAFQAALSNGRASIVFTLMNGIGLIIPIIGGALIFNESLFVYPYYRIIGILLISLGVIIINYK